VIRCLLSAAWSLTSLQQWLAKHAQPVPNASLWKFKLHHYLAFCGETSQNRLSQSEAWVGPRFGLAPTPAETEVGALIVSYVLGSWFDRDFHGVTGSKCNLDSNHAVHARRSLTSYSSRACSTAHRRRSGLRSFPPQYPSGSFIQRQFRYQPLQLAVLLLQFLQSGLWGGFSVRLTSICRSVVTI